MIPTDDEILKALNESGYLFEQEIATTLEQHSFHIQTNAAFNDEDEEKSREIDVAAYQRVYFNEEKKTTIGIRIICECKNSQTPFVFINRNKSEADAFYWPPNFLFPQKEFQIPVEGKANIYRNIPAFLNFGLDKVYPFSKSDTKAVQFCKMVRKGKEWQALHDGIYDSILFPLIKCLIHFKNRDAKQVSRDWSNYVLYFPIVVLNSKIYAVDSHIDAGKIKQVEYISFTRDINSKKIEGKYLIDFVTKEGLHNYLTYYIQPFVDAFIGQVANQTL